jgi:hypothetical protein
VADTTVQNIHQYVMRSGFSPPEVEWLQR